MKKLILTLGIIAGLNSLYAGPIHEAAASGDLNAIASFVNEGGNIDEEDFNGGYTPLMYAAFEDQILAVNLLISLGANIDAVATCRSWGIRL